MPGGSWHLPGFSLVLPGELVSPPLISLPPSHGPLFPGDSLEVAFALSLSRCPPNPAGLVLWSFSECEHFPQGQSLPLISPELFHSALTMNLISSQHEAGHTLLDLKCTQIPFSQILNQGSHQGKQLSDFAVLDIELVLTAGI